MKLIPKTDLLNAFDLYWEVVNRAREVINKKNPDKEEISVDEIHIDPEEDYVFVSWSWWDYEEAGRNEKPWDYGDGDGGRRETSTTYRINKFLSLINKDAEVDPNDKIPVELKGVRDGRKGH